MFNILSLPQHNGWPAGACPDCGQGLLSEGGGECDGAVEETGCFPDLTQAEQG